MRLEAKIDQLKEYFQGHKVIIAFSGGADSTLLAKIAQDYSTDACAVTVDNGAMPSGFNDNTRKIAHQVGINHLVIEEDLLQNSNFASNHSMRCFLCKKTMHDKIGDILKEKYFDFVADGTNITDLFEDRPGVEVNYQKNIKMPLVEVALSAMEVRELLKDMKISYSSSTTCLATRIPSGSFLTTKKLQKIDYAEKFLKNLSGTEYLRVRDEDGTAVIEMDYTNLLDNQSLSFIDSELKSVGFRKVTLDLTGSHHHKKDMIIYKPCQDIKNRIMFETELPYQLDLEKSCEGLKKIGNVKCSLEMGVALFKLDESNVTIFSKGKIVARGVKDPTDAEAILCRLMPYIRRKL
jgi:pyridinium-3,5-biscarboxylic acid mononucleotide sulfurtransferase